MKISIAFTLLAVLSLSGCKAPPPPVTDDTLVTSEVDGVALTHRHVVQAPHSFTPVNETYRALYGASVMTSPDFSGKIVRYLDNGKDFIVLGEVENHWLAIADADADADADGDQQQLVGYVPFKAGVKTGLYDATVKSDRPRPRKNAKKVCVDVGGQSKACRNNNTATWILE